MNQQSGYINIDIAGMVATAVLLAAILFGAVGVVVGIFLPDAWAWAKTILHGWTAP